MASLIQSTDSPTTRTREKANTETNMLSTATLCLKMEDVSDITPSKSVDKRLFGSDLPSNESALFLFTSDLPRICFFKMFL